MQIGTSGIAASRACASRCIVLLLALWIGAQAASGAPAQPPTVSAPPKVPIVDAPPPSIPLEFPWRAWRLFSSNDLLPNNRVYSIAQDADGHVYAGLGDGLARYDGATWERVALPGVDGVHEVGAVYAADDRSVWIGTDGVGVFRVHDGRVDAIAGLAGPAATVYALIGDRDGVWASTDGGLARCTRTGCTQFPPLRGKPVRVVARGVGPRGPCLWVGTSGQGLMRFDLDAKGDPVPSDFHLTRADGLPNPYVSPIVQWGGAQGRDLWIGTGRGLAHYDGHRMVRYTPAVGFPGSVQALLPGRGADRGVLFVGLRPGGLAMVREDGSWGLLGQAQGLPDSAVQSLAYTERGSSMPLLWVGTVAGGIARADPGRWQLLDERRDVPARGMAGLGSLRFPDGMETLWMGSAGGTLRLTDTGWKPVEGVPSGTVVADLAATADGSLWVAGQTGLWRLHGSDRKEFTVDNSQLPAVYADLLAVEAGPAGNDTLWIGTGHGLARWTEAEGLQRDRGHPLLAAGTKIDALTMAALGHEAPSAWAATQNGLVRRHGDRWQRMAADCLRGSHVTSLAAHDGPRGGEVWIGTDGPLLRLRVDGCERIDGLFANGYAEQIAFDRGGRAYVFGTGGAVRLDSLRDAPLASLARTPYGPEDGLLARDFLGGRGVATDARGRVWVASTAALQVFDPASESVSGHAAKLVWESATAGSRALPLARDAELAAGTSPLVFTARLLSFEREEHIQYRIHLAGLQREPQPWTSDDRFEFSRLAPGSYEARIWARDANGVVSGPLTFPFRVLAPWWMRPWALALDALALIACGLLLGWWRSRALHRRAGELASQVAARTTELADANRLLEEMSRTDTLTGLHNRRHAVDALPAMVRKQDERRRAGSVNQLLLVLIDVDHFKRINDTYGHAAGDVVLQTVARRLRQGVRDTDMLVRWGGEEFLLALNDCDPALAAARLRKVLAAVSDAPVAVEGSTLKISVSAGAAAYVPPGDGDSKTAALALERAIAHADAALYEAKNRGRDRAVLVVDAVEAVAGHAHWPEFERATGAEAGNIP